MSSTFVFYSQVTTSDQQVSLWLLPEEGQLRDPYGEPDDPRIGVFQGPLDPSLHQDLVRRIEALPADVSGGESVPPGTLLTTLGVGDRERTRVMHQFASNRPPPAVEPVLERLRAAMDALRRSPRRVLRASARWEQPSFEVERDLRAELRLRNDGAEAIEVSNPAAGGPALAGAALLLLRPSDTAPSGQEFVEELELEDGDVVALPPAAGVAPETGSPASLAPGQELRLEVRHSLRLPPGSYLGLLRLEFPSPSPGDELAVGGRIDIELGAFTVTRPAAPHSGS